MGIQYFETVEQGSDEWHGMRRGILTCSEIKHIMSPKTLKASNNDKTRSHVWELAAQRISGFTEPSYIGDNMLRGWEDEIKASILYSDKYAEVTPCGFITNDNFGFKMGYSPDGLVGSDGLIEVKSRVQKYQIETIVGMDEVEVPEDFILQIQGGLIVSGRKWCDFLSYSAGLPMVRIRCELDPTFEDAILTNARAFERLVREKVDAYRDILKKNAADLHPTEREDDEIIV